MRLLSSIIAAAAALDEQAADRVAAWADSLTTPDEAPRETPLGFTPATGVDAPDAEAIINAAADRGLAGEQRDRWLAEVKMRLDLSTGGPWCTEERDKPTGRLMSPYGVIATGVTREADRDLIEECRADLFGLLALAEHDDNVIKAWEDAAASHASRRHEVERDMQVMEHRLRAVDMVADAWVDGSLKGYRYQVDPNEPAGRVRAAIEGITASRGKTIRDLQMRIGDKELDDGELAGMHEREAAVDRVLDSLVDGRLKLAEYVDPETPAGRVKELITTLLAQVRDAENGAQVQHLTDALQVANRNNAAMKGELDRARALLEAAQQDGTASHLEVSAVMGAYDRGRDLGNIDVREDSLAERVVSALIVERGRAADLEGKLAAHHRHDTAQADDDSPFMAAPQAIQHAHTIGVALDMYDNGADPLASLTLHHPLDLSGRVAALASEALRLKKGTGVTEGARDAMYYAGMRDAAALAPEETIKAVQAAAAARIRTAADLADQAIAATPVGNDLTEAAVDAAAADAFVAGLRAAADLAIDETPEADPNVAHIDTVNGRGAEYTPGPFVESILNAGGTVVVDDNGDPHVTDIPLIATTGAGTLITNDGKRHRFIGGGGAADGLVTAEGGIGTANHTEGHLEGGTHQPDGPRHRTDHDTEATDE